MLRTVHRTPERLELRDRPIVAPAFCAVLLLSQVAILVTRGAGFSAGEWLMTLIFAGATSVAFAVSGVATTVRLDARERVLRWARTGLWPWAREEVSTPLDAIVRIGVQELPPGADTGPSWRLVVATRSRTLPLSLAYANFGDQERLAESVRDWLRAAGVSLREDAAAV